MNLIANQTDEKIKIIVDSLLKEEDLQNILNLLDEPLPIEINFLNIQSLPYIIILKLEEKKDSISIFTNELTLKNYLLNLGFRVTFNNGYLSQKKDFKLNYIAIGGSAGSIKKFIEIIQNLPKSDISIFIIMHQKEDVKSSLSTILQIHTTHYKIQEAQTNMKIEPATIYTAPAGYHMIVSDGYIFLTDEEKKNFAKPSISVSFESLSNEYKNSLLAILVCGYGADGSDVLELLQKNSSTIIIENPSECEAKPMLENAIKTECYNFIFSLNEINNFIKQSILSEFITDDELKRFLYKIYQMYGYNYSGYTLNHIRRRVQLFYNTVQSKNFMEFENLILNNKSIFKDLFLNISVNITTFYRNPEVFKVLKNDILPKLDSFLDIKIWCAGCSSGEEPYSIAIFLDELGLLDRSIIYATDLNEVILNNAKNGIYSKKNFEHYRKNYYQAGGTESFSSYFDIKDNFVNVKKRIKDRILFFRHNLVQDSKINDFQLIFCRNVVIYFDKELKKNVFNLFNQSLDNFGFLVLGESESLENNLDFKTIDKKNKIYKRNV